MNAQTVVSFIRYIRENPDLAHDRKEFVKNVKKSGDMMFKMKKELIRRSIDVQKKDLTACFDIWNKFSQEHGIDIRVLSTNESALEEFIEAAVKAFGIEKPEPDISDEKTKEE